MNLYPFPLSTSEEGEGGEGISKYFAGAKYLYRVYIEYDLHIGKTFLGGKQLLLGLQEVFQLIQQFIFPGGFYPNFVYK